MKILAFILIIISGIFNSQELKHYGFDSLPEKLEKPILIYMKTDWCSICKIQKYQIEKDLELKKLMDENVYFIIFNPEKHKESIKFFGGNYNYISNGNSGIHELAVEISSNKKPVYPSWVLINRDGKVFFRNEGLVDNGTLKLLMGKLN
ncbi:thiol:disulfide interchange protein [Epilithonimonas sp. JDS]|uniref:thiol:disulfide interchange protein n=1 Tax=Epilithonimonas sp. JDS TaxID=2902797 RepID=UPI001E45DC48|nr:thiol:disulfide interchange protein [Epilithonimonas sp. JDS]MCD9853719.1 thiol:disulfide interchange protein [Epilithonimonas sp. JDS]